MRVLTYIDGVLYLINEEGVYKGKHEKPSFITGIKFQYEPTLKQMDGLPLTDTMIEITNNYIDNFQIEEPTPTEAIVPTHRVDEFGNYLGLRLVGLEVPSAPPTEMLNPYWNGTAYTEGVVVNKDTGAYIGVGDNRVFANGVYAPLIGMIGGFKEIINVYDFTAKTWSVDMEDARKCRLHKIKDAYNDAISGKYKTDELVDYEPVTFQIQVAEAKQYKLDATAPTPFIDMLILARGFDGETRETLIDKILYKNSLFTHIATELGLYHKLLKRIEDATSLDQLRAVEWL